MQIMIYETVEWAINKFILLILNKDMDQIINETIDQNIAYSLVYSFIYNPAYSWTSIQPSVIQTAKI